MDDNLHSRRTLWRSSQGWAKRVDEKIKIHLPFSWTVVALTLIVIIAVVLHELNQEVNQVVLWILFLSLAVIVHEFGHAFQAKLRGHHIKEPTVAWVRLRVKTVIALLLVIIGWLSFSDFILIFGYSVIAGITHPQKVVFMISTGWRVALGGTSQSSLVPLFLIVAAGILFWGKTGNSFLNAKVKIPMGVGMHIQHVHRDISDILAGVTCECALWLVLGVWMNPLCLWMIPATLVINLIIPISINGEGNDGMAIFKEQRARLRGDNGLTSV